MPHLDGGVIEFSGDCWRWCIRHEGVVGYQGCSIGLCWYEITQYVISDSIFHYFPTALRAQQAAFPLLTGFFTSVSERFLGGYAVTRYFSEEIALIA
jgi:hypothetical protein